MRFIYAFRAVVVVGACVECVVVTKTVVLYFVANWLSPVPCVHALLFIGHFELSRWPLIVCGVALRVCSSRGTHDTHTQQNTTHETPLHSTHVITHNNTKFSLCECVCVSVSRLVALCVCQHSLVLLLPPYVCCCVFVCFNLFSPVCVVLFSFFHFWFCSRSLKCTLVLLCFRFVYS